MSAAFGERSVDDLLAMAHATLERVRGAGAPVAEVYIWEARCQEVHHSRHRRTAEESDRSGVSVRAAVDGRLAFSTTSGLRERDLEWVADRAVRAARLVPPSKRPAELPEPGARASPSAVDPTLARLELERLMALGSQMEAVVAASPTASYFECRLNTHVGRFVVVNTNGLEAWDRHAHEGALLDVRATRGRSHKMSRALAVDREPLEAHHDVEAMAQDALQRARDATRPGALDGLVDRVVLDAPSASHLLSKVVPSFTGHAAEQGRSNFAGKLGEAVASEALTMVDRPHGPGGCRHQRVDDEGVPTREVPLISKGVLESYIYSWSAAREYDRAPTGHGLRPLKDRYGARPSPRAANLQVAPGDWTMEELVESVDRGVLVRDAFLGDFTMDRLAGDFSFVAPLAYYVEGGEVKHPLVSTAVSGNLFDALHAIWGVGKEVARNPVGEYVPLGIDDVTCAT